MKFLNKAKRAQTLVSEPVKPCKPTRAKPVRHAPKPVQGVALVVTKLELGGAQKVCLSLFRDLIRSGRDAVLMSGTEGLLVEEAKSIGPTILLPALTREVGLRGLWNEVKAFFALWREFRKLRKRYSKVVVHTHSSKAGVMGRWAAWFAGCRKIVHTVHGYPFNDFQPRVVRWVFRALEYVTSFITTRYVCVSRRDEEYGKRSFPKFSSVLIRAAVPCENFTREASRVRADGEPLVIGSIGCFKPQKNLLDLLRAFEMVRENLSAARRDAVKLEIVGDGEMRSELERWIAEHGLSESVILSGWCDDVASKLVNWDLFAMSSLWEGLPCAVVEARLSRLPVVAYDVGGINEVITDGENGFVVESGNWLALAVRMWQLVSDDKLRERCSSWSDSFDEFSDDVMCRQHRSLYDEL